MIHSKKKPLLLATIIALLLISDSVLLYLVVRKKQEHASTRRFTNYMTDLLRTKVGFSEEQVSHYKELRTAHKKNMGPLYDQTKATKKDFYKLLLQTPVPDSVVYQYLDSIGKQQVAFDQATFYHFLSLRELCTPDQLPLLAEAMKDLPKYQYSGK